MYLNLVQIAESFGVSERVIEDWIRREGLPHIPERGRLLFDRTQVAGWAAARGLAAHAGFLAPSDPALANSWRLEPLMRRGGIVRDLPAADVVPTLAKRIADLPGASESVRRLVADRIQEPGGIRVAPVGEGIALPHPSARIALGRDSGAVVLLLLREPLPSAEPTPDNTPVTRLLFFIAPTPRAHLNLLGRLSRLVSRPSFRALLAREAADAELFAAVAAADETAIAGEAALR